MRLTARGVPLRSGGLYRAERVPELIIMNTCPQDLVEPNGVGFNDLVTVLGCWGDVGSPADFVPPRGVGFEDMLEVLGAWGPCP